MPLNSIPPTTVEGLKLKREVAARQAFVDVGFWGGAVPGNLADLRRLHDEGVFGFKCFLLHSGVDEFPHLEAEEMETDMAGLKSFDSLMIVHAEDSHAIDRAPHPGGDHYANFLSSRPRGAAPSNETVFAAGPGHRFFYDPALPGTAGSFSTRTLPSGTSVDATLRDDIPSPSREDSQL